MMARTLGPAVDHVSPVNTLPSQSLSVMPSRSKSARLPGQNLSSRRSARLDIVFMLRSLTVATRSIMHA